MSDNTFTALAVGLGLGLLIARIRPEECASCGRPLTPISDASQLDVGDQLAHQINAAITMGGEFFLQKTAEGAGVWFQNRASGMLEKVIDLP